MPSPDLSALIRWPSVPACYGWLSLDQRGRWRLQGELVTHQGFIEFINRQYGCDNGGNWFLQNGPQRVFAALEYTPWILRLSGSGNLQTHTGIPVEEVKAVFMDEDGALIFSFSDGVGALDDRDLAQAIRELSDADNGSIGDEQLIAALNSSEDCAALHWRGIPLKAIRRNDVPAYFGFIPNPFPASG